ncbi:AraC family transcriptional regulator [Vibrio sp. EA2]|uniref:helix-turn-helix domain-containing protein n=1 Tax=Vibrio sp. EA2 TaxID=3079860 RepID=UPI002949B58E|nr:AraC family transcriptional regulator [Vibrio sp. EA2]MDV6249931.1 AraC family transcriptional regulator [Vibrio sp. EA2]
MGYSVSSLLINRKVDLLSSIGVDVDSITSECNINKLNLTNPNGRIPYQQSKAFIIKTSEYNQYIYKEYSSVSGLYDVFPQLFNLCLNESNAVNAIDSFLKYRFIIGDSDHCHMDVVGDSICVEYSNTDPTAPMNGSVGHFLLIRDILSKYTDVLDCQLMFDSSIRLGKNFTNDQFESKCLFDQNKNQMIIKSSSLFEQNNTFNEFLYGLQKNNVECLRQTIQATHTFSSVVKGMIKNLLEDKYFINDVSLLEEICHQVGVSRWTLNRKLNAEKTSFSELTKDIKMEKACRLLGSTNKSVSEISELCGFSSQSNFTKFMRKNHDMSPVQYRKAYSR